MKTLLTLFTLLLLATCTEQIDNTQQRGTKSSVLTAPIPSYSDTIAINATKEPVIYNKVFDSRYESFAPNTELQLVINLKRYYYLRPVTQKVYPPEANIASTNVSSYTMPTFYPSYLQRYDAMQGTTITRISDSQTFGCDCSKLRHRYAKNQAFNSDGTMIMTGGSPSKIIDGTTYLPIKDSYTLALWSNTEPHYTYDSNGKSFVKKNVLTNAITTLHTFNEFDSVSVGYDEGNLTNDDSYVALVGVKSGQQTLVVYDIKADAIVSKKNIGTANLDWISMSQLGNFVVVMYKDSGSGQYQGTKSYDVTFNNEVHLTNNHPHGDIGIDAQGNEVFVSMDGLSGYSLSMVRLDTAQKTGLFPTAGNKGIYGGHISCRNTKKPGWAVVSNQGHETDMTRSACNREVFAIKLDNSGTIMRYGKHHNYIKSYLHDAQAVPNHDLTKIIFASNYSHSAVISRQYPDMYVLELK